MKRITMALAGIVCASTTMGFAAGSMLGQDAGQDMPPEMAAMMKAYEEYGKVGAPQKQLARRVGNWNVEMTMWQAPGAPPEKMTGSATFQALMGGRFILQNFQGDSPMGPFEGAGLSAYDNLKKKYQGIWIDSMASGIAFMEGEMKDRAITYKGYMPDPPSGKFKSVKTIERMPDDNTFIMEMHDIGADGKTFQTMEIKYTRAS